MVVNQDDTQNLAIGLGEISVEDLLNKFKAKWDYIKKKWKSIFIISIIGGLLGLAYSILKKPHYTAVCTFVLEDSKNGGSGQFGSLAALAGINLGSGGSGIFEGDNILELYKSRTMIEKTLLSICSFDGKQQLLIDRYLNPPYQANKNKTTEFNGDFNKFTRRQDSIITSLVNLFNKEVLNVNKPDKKLNIISVSVETKDELFSKFFTEKLVQNVNDFYVQTKTKKAVQNVQILQRQMDSLKIILNKSINGVASAQDESPNANPALTILRTTSQKRQLDVQANTVVYGQMVQNLELAKISLRENMPLIQIIDKPVLPLIVYRVNKVKAIFIGMFLGGISGLLLLICMNVVMTLKKRYWPSKDNYIVN